MLNDVGEPELMRAIGGELVPHPPVLARALESSDVRPATTRPHSSSHWASPSSSAAGCKHLCNVIAWTSTFFVTCSMVTRDSRLRAMRTRPSRILRG